jgi:Domain of unknown function (DUF222)/HNH endonuclease
VTESPLERAHRLLTEAADALVGVVESGTDNDLLSVITMGEGAARRIDRATVGAVAVLQRRGFFVDRGYKSTASALSDLVGWELFEARRRTTAAEQVTSRTRLDGTPLPATLPATAAVFTTGKASLRHVEVIARVLGSRTAQRLTPEHWAGAERQMAAKTDEYTPKQLGEWGAALVELLDQDGEEPDDRPPADVNELFVTRNASGSGGRVKGRFDDSAMFDEIAALLDAKAKPHTGGDDRTGAERTAEALAEVCGFVLDHGPANLVPEAGGHRPHINVLIRLEDLENRARAAALDFGGGISPEGLRMLCCDAAVVPIVMNGKGQPLDVGRATRTIPDGLRRAVAARDRGCAYPGCGRPVSWCECHHTKPWESGGETKLNGLVMLCRHHHRLIHFTEWIVRIRDGLPEFIPPKWLDPQQQPRRKPLTHLVTAT